MMLRKILGTILDRLKLRNHTFDAKIESAFQRHPQFTAPTGHDPYTILAAMAAQDHILGDRLYTIITKAKPGIACVHGCNHCCHLNSTRQTGRKAHAVGMTLLDGVVLLDYLVAIRHTPIAARIWENDTKVWDDAPQTMNRLLCPFDVDGHCAVYAARPQVCRLYFSNNATHCAFQADVPADQRQVDTPIARTLRPIRKRAAAQASSLLQSHFPNATFGYFDFLTVAHTLVEAVMTQQDAELRSKIGAQLSL